MKKPLKNKLNMYDTVLLLLSDNATIVALRAALGIAQTALIAFVLAIRQTDTKQRTIITGVTQNKKAQKKALVEQTFSVASAVKAFAAKTGNDSLFGKAKAPISFYKKLSDELLPQTSQEVHDLANANVASLADYGITAAVLTAFQTAIDDYKLIIKSPREAIVGRKTQTDLLPLLFSQTDEYLEEQMDAIIETLRAVQTDFVSTYFNAREIVDTGVHHTTIKGVISDKLTSTGISGASFLIVELNREVFSDVNGIYLVQKFIPGTYVIHVKAEGYQLFKTILKAELGKAVELNVQLEKV